MLTVQRYVLSPGVFSVMDKIVTSNYKATSGSEAPDRLMLEGDIFPALASAGQLFVHRSNNYWPVKTLMTHPLRFLL